MGSNTKAMLSYIGLYITGIIFLAIEKDDEFVRKNAAQSVVFGITANLLSIFISFTPFVGKFVNSIFSLLCFIVWIILICKAYNKTYYKLPLIGDISEKYVINWFN
ncbi:MAG: hypothetical protein RUMPE_00352 [Eubacteriales bacterium SKADARSKE-1]|nr:hypothetical protein [Eubacteriales bacterium SKADARSKE-1]